jgi:hypothetical protein
MDLTQTYRSRSLSIVVGSSRRSSLVPTRITGVEGEWCLSSGHHYAIWFSVGVDRMEKRSAPCFGHFRNWVD